MPAAIMENSKRASSTPMMFNIILEQVPDERLGFMIGNIILEQDIVQCNGRESFVLRLSYAV